MPVYNEEQFIFSAVESILNQSFDDFEFIIIDDASTDNTKLILTQIEDSRIYRVYNQKHSGNYACRNQGLSLSKGKYICVMDADDIAHPDRLLKQCIFMESNPHCLAAGSYYESFSDNTSPYLVKPPLEESLIKVLLLKNNIFAHPTLIIRNDIFERYQLRYNEHYYYSSDYDLLTHINQLGVTTNIPEILLRYRRHNKQITSSKGFEQQMYANQIRLKQLNFFRMKPSIDEIIIHLYLMQDYHISKSKLLETEKWCNKLLLINNQLKLYDQKYLHKLLEESLYFCIENQRQNQIVIPYD